jgi:hypothetical protein
MSLLGPRDAADVVDIVELRWIYSEQTPSSTAEKRHPISAVCTASGPVCRLVSGTAHARCHVPTPSPWSLFSVSVKCCQHTHRSTWSVPGLIAAGFSLPVTAMARCRPKRCIRPEMHVGCRAEHILFVEDPQLGRMAGSLVCKGRPDLDGAVDFSSHHRGRESGRRGGEASSSGVRHGLVHWSSTLG